LPAWDVPRKEPRPGGIADEMRERRRREMGVIRLTGRPADELISMSASLIQRGFPV